MDAAAVAAMQAQMVTMAATITSLEAAAGAPAAAAPAIDLAAITAAVTGARGPKDHSKDLDYFSDVCLDETPVPQRADDFITSLELQFANKATPEALKVPLVVPKLKGKALNTFKVFQNANGDTNNAQTTTYTEFRTLMLTLVPNDQAESDTIKKEYDALTQKASAE
eukprot:2743580-Rhodomonas_salina.1